MAGSRGVLGVTGPPTPPHPHSRAIYTIVDLFRLGGSRSMKVAIPIFFWGGGGGRKGVSEEVETLVRNLGKALPPLNYRLPRTVKN